MPSESHTESWRWPPGQCTTESQPPHQASHFPLTHSKFSRLEACQTFNLICFLCSWTFAVYWLSCLVTLLDSYLFQASCFILLQSAVCMRSHYDHDNEPVCWHICSIRAKWYSYLTCFSGIIHGTQSTTDKDLLNKSVNKQTTIIPNHKNVYRPVTVSLRLI